MAGGLDKTYGRPKSQNLCHVMATLVPRSASRAPRAGDIVDATEFITLASELAKKQAASIEEARSRLGSIGARSTRKFPKKS